MINALPHRRSLAYLVELALLLIFSRVIAAAGIAQHQADGPNSHSETIAGSTSADDSAARTRRVQDVVDALRVRLAITEQILVSLVAKNRLVVSVHRSPEQTGAFALSLEAGFFEVLNEEELNAVVAHELGHVWIFTHHPYLQTEELANQIAMRVVSRDSLDKVYAKVWERTGVKGDLKYFPGE